MEDKNIIREVLKENKDLFAKSIPEHVLMRRMIKFQNKFIYHEIFSVLMEAKEAVANRKKYESFVIALHESGVLTMLPPAIAIDLVSKVHSPQVKLPGIPLHLLPRIVSTSPKLATYNEAARDDKQRVPIGSPLLNNFSFFVGSDVRRPGPSPSPHSTPSPNTPSPHAFTAGAGAAAKGALKRHPALFAKLDANGPLSAAEALTATHDPVHQSSGPL